MSPKVTLHEPHLGVVGVVDVADRLADDLGVDLTHQPARLSLRNPPDHFRRVHGDEDVGGSYGEDDVCLGAVEAVFLPAEAARMDAVAAELGSASTS